VYVDCLNVSRSSEYASLVAQHAYLGNHAPEFHHVLWECWSCPQLGPLAAFRSDILLTSGFVDDGSRCPITGSIRWRDAIAAASLQRYERDNTPAARYWLTTARDQDRTWVTRAGAESASHHFLDVLMRCVPRATCRVIITRTERSTATSSTGWPNWDRYLQYFTGWV